MLWLAKPLPQASEVLGYDLWQLLQDGPAEELNQTDRTQPAMLASGVAVWRAWQTLGGEMPVVMAGHSLGEYTALVCAGALTFEDAVGLVAERGRCMQSAVPAGVGGMAAILGLDDEAVAAVCRQAAADEVVTPVNYNSPGQVVIAGHMAAVQRAIVLAKEAGAKRAVELPVSVPSHCALMEPAAERFSDKLQQLALQFSGNTGYPERRCCQSPGTGTDSHQPAQATLQPGTVGQVSAGHGCCRGYPGVRTWPWQGPYRAWQAH